MNFKLGTKILASMSAILFLVVIIGLLARALGARSSMSRRST